MMNTANTGYWNTGDWNTGNCNTGDWNTGYWNTGDWNTGNRNTGKWNTGNRNTGNCNTGDCNTGDCNTGNWNTGYWNTTKYSAGIFNTKEQKTPIFNGGAYVLMSEFCQTDAFKALFTNPLLLTEWVGENSATEEEKNLPDYVKGQGVLISYSFKDACKKWWNSNDATTKALIQSIDGFDTVIFEEVTGISLEADKTNLKEQLLAEIEDLKKRINSL